MSKRIDLFKPFFDDVCTFYTIATFQAEPHKSHIELGKDFLELIHSDVIRPF